MCWISCFLGNRTVLKLLGMFFIKHLEVRDTFTNIRNNKRKIMVVVNTIINVSFVVMTISAIILMLACAVKLILSNI